MHILMIAPEPFFEPRGTAFSEYHRIRALIDLGHTVDLVTYPFGQDRPMAGLRVFRCMRPPFVHKIGIGPSFAKIPLDISLSVTAFARALRGRYDAVHSHEEGIAIGIVLAGLLRVPHLYDMHSSLPQQLTNFAFTRSRSVRWMFEVLERFVIRHSRVVIVICPELQTTVQGIDPDVPCVLIENAPGSAPGSNENPGSSDSTRQAATDSLRASLGVTPGQPVVLYTGTFEPYQGLDLLLDAFVHVARSRRDARLVLAGGNPDQIEALRREAASRGIADVVIFAGQRPSEEIPLYLRMATALVSPRRTGTNTPLKIYQYLRSGTPIVATRLLTHTQVLGDDTAILTPATPEGFAEGILTAIGDSATASAVAARARHLADTKYSYEAYLARTREACAHLAVSQVARQMPA
jgi:glycosyltransferase involved in cell wall biosynthesis